jgi:thermitase
MVKKVLLAGLIFLLVPLFLFNGQSPVRSQESADSFAPDEIMVKFKPQIDESGIEDLNRFVGAKVKEKLLLPRLMTMRVPAGKAQEFAKLFSQSHLVEYAEPNYVAHAFLVPNDPYFSKQWGMTKVNALQAWDISSGSASVKIAILDTGIDQDHEDLAGKIAGQKNFTNSFTLDDKYGHGTHVAGIAAAVTNNNKGVAGLGYQTKLMNVKILDDNGSGYYSWIINGIKWAADNGAKVINLSLGGSSGSKALEDAINYAWVKGVVLACAAGNAGNDKPNYPAYYEKCLATAATNSNDQKASFSTYGSWVDVAAPGVDIFSTVPNQKSKVSKNKNYDYLSGTSMATPHVAGLAALVWATSYGTSGSAVRDRIESTADSVAGTGTYWSKGRINAYEAIK